MGGYTTLSPTLSALPVRRERCEEVEQTQGRRPPQTCCVVLAPIASGKLLPLPTAVSLSMLLFDTFL